MTHRHHASTAVHKSQVYDCMHTTPHQVTGTSSGKASLTEAAAENGTRHASGDGSHADCGCRDLTRVWYALASAVPSPITESPNAVGVCIRSVGRRGVWQRMCGQRLRFVVSSKRDSPWYAPNPALGTAGTAGSLATTTCAGSDSPSAVHKRACKAHTATHTHKQVQALVVPRA